MGRIARSRPLAFGGWFEDNGTFSNQWVFAAIPSPSLSFWYYGNTFPQGALIGRYDTGQNRIWKVGSNVNGRLNILDSGGYVGGSIVDFGASFTTGWNHFVAVFDVDTGEVRVFANGTAAGAAETLDTSGFTDLSSILVGDVRGTSDAENATPGVRLADIRLYNFTLSAAQAQDIYNGIF